MKLTIALIALSLCCAASASTLTYIEKQQITCKAIASAISKKASDTGSTLTEASLAYDGARALCMQSYNQASADYPLKKAKASAEEKAGVVGGLVVEMSYRGYAEDNS